MIQIRKVIIYKVEHFSQHIMLVHVLTLFIRIWRQWQPIRLTMHSGKSREGQTRYSIMERRCLDICFPCFTDVFTMCSEISKLYGSEVSVYKNRFSFPDNAELLVVWFRWSTSFAQKVIHKQYLSSFESKVCWSNTFYKQFPYYFCEKVALSQRSWNHRFKSIQTRS